MTDTRKIVCCRIAPSTRFGEEAKVYVEYRDGDTLYPEELLFSYFEDEISFTGHDLLGLTKEQAYELRHKKDVAFLRS